MTESLEELLKVANLYDGLASVYDTRYDTDYAHWENHQIQHLITGFDLVKPMADLLDAGSGTGLAIELGLTIYGHSDLYQGFDPAADMLDQSRAKHPWADDLVNFTAETYLNAYERQFDTVISLYGSPSYMEPWCIAELADRADRLAVFMHYIEGYFPSYHTDETKPKHADASREAAAALPGAVVTEMNMFQITTVYKG